MKQYASIDDTVYFWFAGNDTSGSGGDGASPAADVRLAGAAADAAPVYSPTPVLLSNAGYPAGAYEVAIVASAGNGFAADNTYAVFCTLAIDSQNPTGFVGSFDTKAVQANAIEIESADPTDTIRDSLVDDATRIDASALNTLSGHDPGATIAKAGDLMGLANDAITSAKYDETTAFPLKADDVGASQIARVGADGDTLETLSDQIDAVPTAAQNVDEFETQSQVDPTGFHVNVKEINGTAQTANDVGGDVNDILDDTAVIGALGAGLTALPWNAAWDAEVQSEVNDALVVFFTSAAQLVDDIWDEILSGATHNIATSAGRRIRELGAYFITGGTAQSGTAHSITLAAGETATDHILNRNLIVILAGTGAGQTRTIVDYDGTSKVAVVDRDWAVNPDNTSEYSIIPDDTPLVTNHGVAQAGSVNTITLETTASAINNTYRREIIMIMAGTGAGQSQLIDSYVGATKVVTTCTNWITNPDNTSVYAIMPYGLANVCNISVNPLAQIQGEVDTALTNYGGPTNAQMVARTIPSADYFDPAADNVNLTTAAIDAFLDEVIGDAVHATPNSVGAMLHAVFCRFMQKRTATDLAEVAYKLDDSTPLKSFTLGDDGTTTTRS